MWYSLRGAAAELRLSHSTVQRAYRALGIHGQKVGAAICIDEKQLRQIKKHIGGIYGNRQASRKDGKNG